MPAYVFDKKKNELVKVAGNAVNNIDDTKVSPKETWSSEKIKAELQNVVTARLEGTSLYLTIKG